MVRLYFDPWTTTFACSLNNLCYRQFEVALPDPLAMLRTLSIAEVEMGVGDHRGGGDLVQEKRIFNAKS